MNQRDTANILAAIQTLVQAGLTFESIKTLMEMPERTQSDVEAQLAATDAAIAAARND